MRQQAYDLLKKIPEAHHFINGEWVKGAKGETFEVKNPANGEYLFRCAAGSKEDVDKAVLSARQAFRSKEWREMPPKDRGNLLTKIANKIEAFKEPFCFLESLHNGKTVKEAGRGDLPPCSDIFRYYAGWVDKFYGETIPVEGPYLNYTLREPVGVVGAIVPWNYPLLLACWKIAPALAMGNTVIAKPSSLTPLTLLVFANIAKECGLPDGVLNVVTGSSATGGALSSHEGVDKISFTGSVETARQIIQHSAQTNLKKLTLELGGKSPQIVFSDADLSAALDGVFWGIFANKGEVCSAGSRLILQREIYETFVDKLAARARGMKVGNPLDPASDIGSLISEFQLKKVLDYVDRGKKEGAKLECGGNRLGEGDLAKGFFMEPTIFTEVSNKMTIAREEIFGPVLSVIPFSDEEEGVETANDSPFGLVSSVWTRDVSRAHRIARDLKAGSVWINCFNGFDSASPFGGFKQSGWGREMGIHALQSYTEVKSVWVNLESNS